MKYLGIISSQNIHLIFEKNNVNNLYYYTKSDNLPLRIGYMFDDKMFVPRFLAIQMDNSSTYETFELFEIENLQTNSEKELKDLMCNIAEEVIQYNKDILRYYKRGI